MMLTQAQYILAFWLSCVCLLAQDGSIGKGLPVTSKDTIAASGAVQTVRQGAQGGHARAGALKLSSLSRSAASTFVSPLGSVVTPSPAESFAISGNLAYVCDDNEITVVDITNPVNPQVVGTATSTLINKSSDIHCAVQGTSLAVFADQPNTTGPVNTPSFVAFDLTNPRLPQRTANVPLNRRFTQAPVYIGTLAFVPTFAVTFDRTSGTWSTQNGDFLAYDLSNLTSPQLIGTLESQTDTTYGGSNAVFGATRADASLIYIGGSTSTANLNNGIGRVQVIDVSNPAALKVTGQIMVPGSIHFYAPVIQGTTAVGIGNTGGYVGALLANPAEKGNIVVATFDVADPRSPALISSTITSYSVGQGGGSARIGSNLFAFSGVVDAANNPVLLTVDITNPQNPVIQSLPIAQPFSSMQAAGSTLYATLGSGGFATYSIPGGSSPAISCPSSIDAMVVFDRASSVSAQTFSNAKTSVKSLIDSLHLSPDQVGVVAVGSNSNLLQTLTINGARAKGAMDGIETSTKSYIGSGITSAQTELTSARHNASATPLMIVVSDGTDQGSPGVGATLSAASAAKSAGIRIISLQYGSAAGTLMQSIASSTADYYLAPAQ